MGKYYKTKKEAKLSSIKGDGIYYEKGYGHYIEKPSIPYIKPKQTV